MGVNGGKALMSVYDGNVSTDVYSGEFLKVYNAVLKGNEIPEVSHLTSAQKQAAIFSAQNDLKAKNKISSTMSDAERAKILEKKQIELVRFEESEFKKAISKNPQLLDKKLKNTDAKKILSKIGLEFNVFDKYSNSDIELEFEFGKNNLYESVQKQKGHYDIYAQMLSCFSDIISNAIGVEVHNRNAEGYKV